MLTSFQNQFSRKWIILDLNHKIFFISISLPNFKATRLFSSFLDFHCEFFEQSDSTLQFSRFCRYYPYQLILMPPISRIFRSNMKRLSNLFRERPMSAIDTAIYWIEYVSRNGFILQSPAMYLTWWQQNLLDVYAFILACVAVVFYIAVLLIQKLKNYIFGCRSCSKQKISESKKKK